MIMKQELRATARQSPAVLCRTRADRVLSSRWRLDWSKQSRPSSRERLHVRYATHVRARSQPKLLAHISVSSCDGRPPPEAHVHR